MPPRKPAWEAETWEEFAGLLDRDHDGDGFEWIKNLVHQREKQRIGDKGRNERRRAILAFAKDHPELLPPGLRKKK